MSVSPLPEIHPLCRIGLVECDDLDQGAGRITALDVNWPTRCGKSENQTTRTMFVVWVVFNYFTTGDGLTEFLDTNAPKDTLVNSVLGKFEVRRNNLLADGLDQLHAV